VSAGYQYSFLKDRMHFNPKVSVGSYQSTGFDDVRDQYFNSVNFKLGLSYDLIRIKAFNINIETGGLINNSRGLKGTGGELQKIESEYVNNWYYGFILTTGIRIAPLNKRFAIKMNPIYIHAGTDYFLELQAMVGFEYKLK
jgi:hypothetical protein